MLPFALSAIAALTLLGSAQAATFVGCVLAAELPLLTSSPQRAASNAVCQTNCRTAGFAYSYYVSGLLTGNNCYCSSASAYLAASAYVLPAGGILTSDTTCIAALQASATALDTTFTFQNCVGTLTGVTVNLVSGTILGGSIVDSPTACFQQCRNDLQAYVIPIVPSVTTVLPSYGCVCNPSGQGTSILCGVGQFYRFTHAASASGQARRRLQEAMTISEGARRKSFCPAGLTSCNVQGVPDAWECVDPSADLESCGGCTHGDYTQQGLNGTATGVDCTSLPGVRMGGSTCTNGKCEIFSCRRNWTLKDGRCVRL
ncbi:hypothetical protein I316_00876 [Kwoniella heveanensis BCC8398]|uniref:Protein CPL1-like domain-containing protein n=1 Tax=Kwoniella heveanensis BCC8398 TaxID=1296120 RepID=A0A1B9H3B0_9TREE|nr:hypothetical protein I316_00876 [Kwoniella heveanensis BCC8398]